MDQTLDSSPENGDCPNTIALPSSSTSSSSLSPSTSSSPQPPPSPLPSSTTTALVNVNGRHSDFRDKLVTQNSAPENTHAAEAASTSSSALAALLNVDREEARKQEKKQQSQKENEESNGNGIKTDSEMDVGRNAVDTQTTDSSGNAMKNSVQLTHPSQPQQHQGQQSSTRKTINVNIKTTTGGSFAITVDTSISVDDFKKQVGKKLKLSKDRICLLNRER